MGILRFVFRRHRERASERAGYGAVPYGTFPLSLSLSLSLLRLDEMLVGRWAGDPSVVGICFLERWESDKGRLMKRNEMQRNETRRGAIRV